MVGVAQLVELRIVIPAVVGSSPIVHPIESPSKKASARKLQQETFSREATRPGQAPSSTPLNPAARKLQQETFSRGAARLGQAPSSTPFTNADTHTSEHHPYDRPCCRPYDVANSGSCRVYQVEDR